MLYIVSTPIGNLKDITLRTLEVLKEVDGIICEDTRRTALLLNHYRIRKPLTVLNDFNEARMITTIVEWLQYEDWALVSDAGTPLVADPGYKLVRECLSQNIPVDSLPGPSSILPALTLSGLPPDKFLFLGYLPEKEGKRIKLLELLQTTNSDLPTTYIVFVSPHKLIKTLESMKKVFGDVEVCLVHELTKIHQSVETKQVTKWLEILKNPKGEYVLLFNPFLK